MAKSQELTYFNPQKAQDHKKEKVNISQKVKS
jgi:hypothetical protein